MTGYRLRIQHPTDTSVADLDHLEDLAERIALEQLAHELNPVTPAGYVVWFVVTVASPIDRRGAAPPPVADGHFYVRTASCLGRIIDVANRPN